MKSNIQEDHGSLCSLYRAYEGGDDNEGWGVGNPKQKGAFRSEGDSPSFIHAIPTGLRSLETPAYGGWGGRYVKVRENTWLDIVPVSDYEYPKGRWYTKSAWGRCYTRSEYPENQDMMREYFKPMTRWIDALQNDFAARADWCVKSYKETNHPPVVKINHDLDLFVKTGEQIQLSAKGTFDPDKDELTFHWWQYEEADTYNGKITIKNPENKEASFTVPNDIQPGETIHIICEVIDNCTPRLTRYQRIIIKIKP